MIRMKVKNSRGRKGIVKATRKDGGDICEVLVQWMNDQFEWVDPKNVEVLADQDD